MPVRASKFPKAAFHSCENESALMLNSNQATCFAAFVIARRKSSSFPSREYCAASRRFRPTAQQRGKRFFITRPRTMKRNPHASAAHDSGIVRADSNAARQPARLMAGLAECVRFIFYDTPRTPKAATCGAAGTAFIIPRLNIAHQRAAAHRTALFRRQIGRDERNRRGISRRGHSPIMKPGAHFPFGAARHQKRTRLIFGIVIAPFRRSV